MYLKKTYSYGNRIEIRKYHTTRFHVKGEKRQHKEKPTPEQMKKYNERQCVKKLQRLMINNFDEGDWHLVLTYRPESRPDPDGAKKILNTFFRKLRNYYRKHDIELKYILVTEWKTSNIHHHLVLNDVPGIGKAIRDLWHGGNHFTPLYEEKNFNGLAAYFVKETKKTFQDNDNPWKQRYTCSRNLKKPEEKTEVIKSSNWQQVPTVPKSLQTVGYVLDKDSVVSGFDVFGFPYLEYTFIKYRRKLV